MQGGGEKEKVVFSLKEIKNTRREYLK